MTTSNTHTDIPEDETTEIDLAVAISDAESDPEPEEPKEQKSAEEIFFASEELQAKVEKYGSKKFIKTLKTAAQEEIAKALPSRIDSRCRSTWKKPSVV